MLTAVRRIGPRHFRCRDCNELWTLTGEQQMALMRMTPTCPECGGTNVAERVTPGRSARDPEARP